MIGQIVWEDLTRDEPFNGPAFRPLPPGKDRNRLRYISQQLRTNVANGRLPGLAPILDGCRARVDARL